MGHLDGAHTHGSGGSGGAGVALLVILAAALLGSAAGPAAHAAAELLRLALITLAAVAAVAVLGLVGLVAWRLRHGRANAARPVRMVTLPPPRPAQALPAPRFVHLGEQERPAIERPAEVHHHLHLHGLTAKEAAAIIRQAHLYGTGNEHPAIEED